MITLILKYSTCIVPFELRDVEILQDSTGETVWVTVTEREKSPLLQVQICLELPWFFFFFYIWSSTSDSRLASWYGNRRKKKQSTINLTAAKWRKQETWRKYQACCRSHKGILGMVTYSGGKFLSQHPFTLLEQPAALEGNKVETVVEYKSPHKHL